MPEVPTMGQLPKIWRDRAAEYGSGPRSDVALGLKLCADDLERALRQSAASILETHERHMNAPAAEEEKA